MTSPPLSQEQILSICKRIDDAKANRGEMPTAEEMRAALDSLRANRRAAPSKSTAKGPKAPATPVDLDSLFT